MPNDLSTDFFDCPHCKINSVTYSVISETSDYETYESEGRTGRYEIRHYIIRCNRQNCERLTYLKIKTRFNLPGTGWRELHPAIIEIQYPSGSSELPNYVPENIRKYFKEAVEAYSFGLHSAASIMCRKVIYEICDKQKVRGKDYKEKINNLGFDRRITDPLINIKNIGDESVHTKGWDSVTIQKAIDVLAIIIEMIYIQEQRIKDFTKHYTTENKNRKNTD